MSQASTVWQALCWLLWLHIDEVESSAPADRIRKTNTYKQGSENSYSLLVLNQAKIICHEAS